MSLITRCPTCETLFKVVPDQLRISEGWVRCGQCDEIFDASLHLLQASPEDVGPAVPPEEEEVVPYDEMVALDATPPSVDIDLDSVGPDDVLMEPVQMLPDATGEDAASMSEGFSRADDVSARPMTWRDAQVDGSQPAPAIAALSGPIFNDEPDSVDGLSDVSFLRDKRTDAFWRKPLMRATLVLLCLTLLLGLTGQMVVHERDRMLALAPGLKPWLLALCGPLNCTLSPLRRIESIVIDSSSFARIRGDAYRLNFTLKNTATTALAVPAIELTLTDSLDQPVVRRIFLVPELGVNSDTLAAGAEWPASLAMAVKAGGTVDRIAGYRLLAFYP